MTDTADNIFSSVSNHFGHFRFSGIPVGETYILMAYHKRHTFYPQVIRSFEDMFGVLVIAENNQRITLR